MTAHSSYRAKSQTERSKPFRQSQLFWSHERHTIKTKQSLGFYAVFVYRSVRHVYLFPPLPPSCVTGRHASDLIFMLRGKIQHWSAKREKDESERHIWPIAKLRLPQDLLRATLLAHTTALAFNWTGNWRGLICRATFSRTYLTFNGLQCQDTAMQHHHAKQAEIESLPYCCVRGGWEFMPEYELYWTHIFICQIKQCATLESVYSLVSHMHNKPEYPPLHNVPVRLNNNHTPAAGALMQRGHREVSLRCSALRWWLGALQIKLNWT